jgi:CRISPR-associated endonuclease/helicase Cas3
MDIAKDSRFREASAQYALSQGQRMAIFDNPQRDPHYEVTRKVDYPQVSVIPLTFRDAVTSLSPLERRWYEVKMPAWYVKKRREVRGDVVFCEMEYDAGLGARFTDTPELAYMMT